MISCWLLPGLNELGYLWHVVVEVACSQGDEHVEIAAFHQIEHVVLLYLALLYAWLQVVVDEIGGHSRDGQLACGIDLCEDHLVEMAERIGEVFVEIACASVQVGLEDDRDLSVRIDLLETLGALQDLFRVVRIVGEKHVVGVLHLEVEASIHTVIGLHSIAQFLRSATVELCHGHGSHAVLDVDGDGLAEVHVLDIADG